jgi:hypothetical protein
MTKQKKSFLLGNAFSFIKEMTNTTETHTYKVIPSTNNIDIIG